MKHAMASTDASARLKAEALHLDSLNLTDRQVQELDLLMTGALFPFLEYTPPRQWEEAGLSPVVLATSSPSPPGVRLVLRHPEGMALAVLTVRGALPTAEAFRDGIPQGFRNTDYVLLGKVEGIERPPHHAFPDCWFCPDSRRSDRAKIGVSARRFLHRPDQAFLTDCQEREGSEVLLFPQVSPRYVGDDRFYSRVRAWQAFQAHLDKSRLVLAPVPDSTGSVAEALTQGLVMVNMGCDRLCFPDFPVRGPEGQALKKAFDQSMLADRARLLSYDGWDWNRETATFVPPGADGQASWSEREWRQHLDAGEEIPDWLTWPEILREARWLSQPRSQQGFTVFFTGLSGSGKSTTAQALVAMLLERVRRKVTLLDGDLVRQNLSSELTFSKAHRDLNIRRIGFVAHEITRHGGIAVCAPIAPYRAIRDEVRHLIEPEGGFFEIHVATPLEICEKRDRKGLYAKARAGKIASFTGISDPYETPEAPDVTIDTESLSPEESARKIIRFLEDQGYVQ